MAEPGLRLTAMKKLKALKIVKTVKMAASSRLVRILLLFFVFPGPCSLVTVLCPPHAQAEVPVKFTYQGNLRQAGFLVNGQRSMVFRIYGSSDSAKELWTSPVYNVSLSTGVFRVTLEPVITDWQSGNLWLELEVEGNRMSPMEELTSSPYSINSLMLSGKRYTTAPSAPLVFAAGDLWYNSLSNDVKFWNGTDWVSTSGSDVPHAITHSGAGSDPILSLGDHTVTGSIVLEGILNPTSNLNIGGGGYSVRLASSVTAGWYYGNGSGLNSINASKITSGLLSGNRIGNVIVSTHIVDGSILTRNLADGSVTRDKLNQSGCAEGDILKLSGTQWVCASGSGSGTGLEIDPLSIHNQNVLQAGTTFYVSSGTVNDLNVDNSLKVMGTALLRGAPGQQGLSVDATGNVGIGVAGAAARLEVRGVSTQNYSLAVGVGAAHQVVVSTSGAVGIGTETPEGKLAVIGSESPGQYIAVFYSGSKLAAWVRNK